MRDRHAGEFAEIHSVGRALDLLEIMQRAVPAGIRVSDAAATLGVDPATVSRLMSTLISRP
jgi:DNA-binding IclR family transcriptional regulator